MAEQKKKKLQFISTDSIILFSIFLIGFILRSYGAAKINFTEFEAAYVLGRDGSGFFTPSLLQNLLNKVIIQLPGYSPLAFRFLSVLAGSFIILLPYFLRRNIGNRLAIICAFFFAFDPFLIADSILITGNTFVLLAAGILVIVWIEEKYELVTLLLFFMTLLGRGFSYFFIALNFFLLIHSDYAVILAGIKSGFSKLKTVISDRIKIGLIVLILVLVFLISSTRLDILIADLIAFAKNFTINYPVGNSPFVYPIALMIYIPFGFALGVFSLISQPVLREKFQKLAMIVGGIFLFLITVFPGHRVIDLVWVSVPIWVACAVAVDRWMDLIETIIMKNIVFLLLIFVSISNLILSFLSLTYKYRFGLSLVDNLIAIFTIIVFIITLVIYWAYSQDLKTALGGLGAVMLSLLLLLQFSAANRTSGFSGSSEREIFWDGYYPDKDLVDDLIETSTSNQLGTMAQVKIWLDREISPEIYWDLGLHEMTEQVANEDPGQGYLVLFRLDEKTIDLPALYIGQKFVAKSYPDWVNSPLRSVVGNDFWMWFFFRDSQQYQEYNYLWLGVGNYP